MERKMLPIGIENFEKLRKEGFYYVDKTGLIKELLENWGEVNLFTRPRRFGKTLNMSMLKSFFEIGSDKTLFDGLSITGEKKLCDAYMGKFPVIFLSFKGVDGRNYQDAYQMLRKIVRAEAARFYFIKGDAEIPEEDKQSFNRILSEKDQPEDILDSLRMMTYLLFRHYHQKVILLVDEYDVPLDKANQNGYYEEMIATIRSMFNQAMKTNDYLQFAVMTGCLRVSKESIFTGLNNPIVHSITDASFDEYFGFVDEEVADMLSCYGLEAHHETIREWYDGYHFGRKNVYCPWDVISYCYDLLNDPETQPKTYWINTSGNDLVKKMIHSAETGSEQMDLEQLIAGKCITKQVAQTMTYRDLMISDQDETEMQKNLWSILLMTGYLTTEGKPSGNEYQLMIPNREVREIYVEQVKNWFTGKAASETENLKPLYEAFESGDAKTIEMILNDQMLDAISFHDAYETFYHGFLLALLNTCKAWRVRSNQETGKGRSDILAERKDRKKGFIAELKIAKSHDELERLCEVGMKQIADKAYVTALKRSRIAEIWTYGIAFYDKECKVIAEKID